MSDQPAAKLNASLDQLKRAMDLVRSAEKDLKAQPPRTPNQYEAMLTLIQAQSLALETQYAHSVNMQGFVAHTFKECLNLMQQFAKEMGNAHLPV